MPSPSDPALLPLATICDRHPTDRTAVVHGDQRWSFGQLSARARRLAGWLAGRGVIADDLVAFSLPNGPDFLALAFAIYRCGATPAPLSPKLPDAERDAIINIMQPRCLVINGDLPDDTGDAALAAEPAAAHVSASWKACTSGGSTGRPKVIVDGRSAAFAPGMAFIDIPRDGCALVPGPLYHNAPFSAAVFALWNGSTVVTMDRFGAEAALTLIAAEQVSWALMVPTMMHRIMMLPADQRAQHDLSHWTQVVHTAAPMAPWLKQAWIDWLGPDHVWEVYGATEGLVRCWIGGREWMERPGSVGRPIGGAQLRIQATDGSEVPTGQQGEVFAMPPDGPRSSYRYIGADRRATADGWETVGDIGHVDASGYLYLADRKDDLIITGGINVWPAEVEAALLRHPAISSCAVFARPDPDLGNSIHAVIESDEVIDLASLSNFLSDHLARAKHPRSIDVTRQTVRDDAGKYRKPRAFAQDTA